MLTAAAAATILQQRVYQAHGVTLCAMQVVVRSPRWAVAQPVLAGAVELQELRSLVVQGGLLEGHDLQLHVLSGAFGSLLPCTVERV